MSNAYRAKSAAAEAAFAAGVFEHEFTPTGERDWLASGLLELVPRTYRVLSNNYAGAAQGETFEAALLIETEAALIQGGHIERVDTAPPRSTTKVELRGEDGPELVDLPPRSAVIPKKKP